MVVALALGGAACSDASDETQPIDPSGTGSGGAGIEDGEESPATTANITGQDRGTDVPQG